MVYGDVMSVMPVVIPDGTKIERLLRDRGYSIYGFPAAMQFGSRRHVYGICRDNRRCSIPQILEIARVLEVRPEDISDYAPQARPRRRAA
jgi:hypothetical protein